MLIHPRVAIASGLAAAAGAIFLIAGRLDGSVLLAGVLVVAVRAAALAADPDPHASRALARVVTVVPVWALLAVVATIRSGSIELAAVRGGHAVAGLGLARGDTLMLLAFWAAALAGVGAVLAPSSRDALLVSGSPANRLEALGLAIQALFLTAVVAGPQVVDPIDLVPWVGGVALLGSITIAAHRVRGDERVARASVALAVVAVALAWMGQAP